MGQGLVLAIFILPLIIGHSKDNCAVKAYASLTSQRIALGGLPRAEKLGPLTVTMPVLKT